MNEQTKAIMSALCSLVIFVAGLFGVSLDNDIVTTIVSAAVLVAVVIWDIWNNHNFTAAAGLAQKVLDALKKDVLTEDEVIAFIEEHTEKKE